MTDTVHDDDPNHWRAVRAELFIVLLAALSVALLVFETSLTSPTNRGGGSGV